MNKKKKVKQNKKLIKITNKQNKIKQNKKLMQNKK